MQLPLPVSLPTDETFESFVVGRNRELVTVLKALAEWGSAWNQNAALTSLIQSTLHGIAIIAGKGRGKSHLLYALCHQFADNDVGHIYLNLDDATDWSPAVFEGLEALPFICLDNVHAIAGKPEWELALFDFINRIAEAKTPVLIWTSELGPAHPKFQLPDLKSRLAWGMTFTMRSLDDEARKGVVRMRAAQRGLKFSEQAVQFLLAHCKRDLPSLLAILDRLDRRSLQEQKKLSVAMVKRELELS